MRTWIHTVRKREEIDERKGRIDAQRGRGTAGESGG